MGIIAFGDIIHEETFLVVFWTSSNPVYTNRLRVVVDTG